MSRWKALGRFDRVASIGKLELHSTAASFGQITALVTPFAPSLAARLNAMGTSPGPARVKLAFELAKNAGQADRGNARAVIDVDAPQLKGITTITAKPHAGGQSRPRSPGAGAQRTRHRVEAVVGAGPLLAGAARARSHDRRRRRPGAIRRLGDGGMGCVAAAQGEDLGKGSRRRRRRHGGAVGAGAQGEFLAESSQRRFRAAARSQTIGHAGAEYRPVLARVAGGQQACLRRSRQQHCRLAVARACGGHAWRRKKYRGRNRPRPARAGAGLCAGDGGGRA